MCKTIKTVLFVAIVALTALNSAPCQAFPGSTVLTKAFSKFGDDIVKGAKKYGDDAIGIGIKASKPVAKVAVEQLGRSGRVVLKRAQKAGISGAKLDEIARFLGKTGEAGVQFVEKHWKAIVGGTGVYALWENEQYRRSQGKSGIIDTTVTRVNDFTYWLFWLAIATSGLAAGTFIVRWLLPVWRATASILKSK
ncbi:hypothetical protein [Dethiosulfovibrio salsuginis]|uniref:Uncharacterized protein n=1 Tax=Dethiosulfovibrio salsuginis TaxID=561720 RepID=A0A1X7K813_9BACT|nr:hypothetical protein [Dethiosulfovibrio salsuginis]SMG36955.1 hypothetical protein SAMN06275492_12239 [Dethiosulfovibrio salsuginis]